MKKRENCADDKALLKICELKNNYYEDVTVLLNLVGIIIATYAISIA
jgi:hypothetical protein